MSYCLWVFKLVYGCREFIVERFKLLKPVFRETSQWSLRLSRPTMTSSDISMKSRLTKLEPIKPAEPVINMLCMVFLSTLYIL